MQCILSWTCRPSFNPLKNFDLLHAAGGRGLEAQAGRGLAEMAVAITETIVIWASTG